MGSRCCYSPAHKTGKPVFTRATKSVDDSANLPSTEEIPDSIKSEGGDLPTLWEDAETADGNKIHLVKLLAEYIGPMANLVGEPVVEQAIDSGAAISELAINIPDAEQAQEFVERTRRLISG